MKINIKSYPDIINKCISFCERKSFKSYDVFDALNGKVIDSLLKNNILLRRIAIQLNARLPFNIRPLLGIKKLTHTKALSDLLSIYSKLYSQNHEINDRLNANKMFDLLISKRIEVDKGYGWGLNFPYATRFTNASTTTPNLYNTLNTLNSILDFYSVNTEINVKEMIEKVRAFIFDYLGFVEESDDIIWLRYYPNQKDIPTPNVNATAAALFMRINNVIKNELIDINIIWKLLNFLQKTQNEDGSWFYTTTQKGTRVDGFHTGFILEALAVIRYFDKESKFPMVKGMLDKGINFYLKNLFTENYVPKYLNDNTYPVEAQNCAQAIQTLARLKMLVGYNTIGSLSKVVESVVDLLYDKTGYFYYKKTRLITNKQFYMRWSQTPMILALLYAEEAENTKI